MKKTGEPYLGWWCLGSPHRSKCSAWEAEIPEKSVVLVREELKDKFVGEDRGCNVVGEIHLHCTFGIFDLDGSKAIFSNEQVPVKTPESQMRVG